MQLEGSDLYADSCYRHIYGDAKNKSQLQCKKSQFLSLNRYFPERQFNRNTAVAYSQCE